MKCEITLAGVLGAGTTITLTRCPERPLCAAAGVRAPACTPVCGVPGASRSTSGLPASGPRAERLEPARPLRALEEWPARTSSELIVCAGSGLGETVTGVLEGTAGAIEGVASGGVVIGVVMTGPWVGVGVAAGAEAAAEVAAPLPRVPCVAPWPGLPPPWLWGLPP
jgi:hypothetical protein